MTGAEGYKLGVSRLARSHTWASSIILLQWPRVQQGMLKTFGKFESLCLILKEDSTVVPGWLNQLGV